MKFWNNFADKHPAAAKWVREGGLFVIVSNLITVFKYLMLQFLPAAFAGLGDTAFGWPGIPVTLFGETFEWNILGYDQAHGGLAYFCAYMVAMVIGEMINFPIQRSFVFRSKGKIGPQIAWYVAAFIVITCIVNSINCVWVAVAGHQPFAAFFSALAMRERLRQPRHTCPRPLKKWPLTITRIPSAISMLTMPFIILAMPRKGML